MNIGWVTWGVASIEGRDGVSAVCGFGERGAGCCCFGVCRLGGTYHCGDSPRCLILDISLKLSKWKAEPDVPRRPSDRAYISARLVDAIALAVSGEAGSRRGILACLYIAAK